ncbi:MAG: GtrA family protein [Acidaminococcaceae bacterium]|nr:GtrA family protein [Acidaminococcaceae bacterium]MDD4721846.1 GtrA family protein [Acidaminococcaceae bacterium]
MAKKIMGFDYSNNEKIKILIYLSIGGTAALIEWGLFYLFGVQWHWNYLFSTTLAFFCSTICHYIMTNIWVFDSGTRYQRVKELTLVLLVSSIGLLFNLMLMLVFVGFLQWPVMLSKVFASCIVVVWNYVSRKKWVY